MSTGLNKTSLPEVACQQVMDILSFKRIVSFSNSIQQLLQILIASCFSFLMEEVISSTVGTVNVASVSLFRCNRRLFALGNSKKSSGSMEDKKLILCILFRIARNVKLIMVEKVGVMDCKSQNICSQPWEPVNHTCSACGGTHY